MEKKMLVSDYDDTFKTTNIPFMKNIQAARHFREKGNIFVIATARDYNSIKSEIDKYNIDCDYVSCLDGANLYDKDGNLIDATYISDIYKLDVAGLREKYKYISSIEPHTHDEKVLYYTILTKLFVRTNELKEELKRNKSYRLRSIPGVIQVVPSMTVKSNSIEYLKKHLGIKDENIFTIGDAGNDIDMIRDYNGFNVLFASPSVYRVSQRPYVMVKHLMEDIENNKVKKRIK